MSDGRTADYYEVLDGTTAKTGAAGTTGTTGTTAATATGTGT